MGMTTSQSVDVQFTNHDEAIAWIKATFPTAVHTDMGEYKIARTVRAQYHWNNAGPRVLVTAMRGHKLSEFGL
jgi:hypothetical protein